GERGRAREELRPQVGGRGREQGLEQLPHDAEGEVALVLAAPGREHAHAPARPPPRLLEEAGLPDPGGALDHREPPLAGARALEQRRERRHLVLPLEQLELGGRLPHVRHGAILGRYRRRYASTASTRRWSAASAGRPSLPKMLVTCFSTARSVTTSRSPIAWFDRPSAISPSTSRSRGVRRSSGSSRLVLPTSRATTAGSSAEPPSATRRTAAANSPTSPTRSFRR